MSRRRVSWIISANIDNWQKNLNKAQKSMNKFASNMQRMGRTMTTFVTAPIVAIGGASLKMAADFDSSMSKIEGLVGVARSEVDRMKESVLDLAGPTAKAPQELADALFFVTSAGFRGADAMDVLEKSAKASAAGLGETKQVADLVTSAINAYGIENLNATQATDTLVAAVREGKAEASELASSMGMVLPIASNLGVTFDQVGAAVAAMTRTGTDAGTASMQLRQILASLLKPTNQAEQAMAEMGTSSAELRRQLRDEGLVTVLGFLRDQMQSNEQAMSRVFPNIRALSGALDIMGANAEENIGIFQRMTNNTGSLDAAFSAAENTVTHQFNKALQGLRTEMIRFGNVMMPVAIQVLEFAQRVIGNFTRMEDEMRKKIILMAGLIGAAGPLMIAIGVAVKIIAAFASLVVAKFALIAGAFALGVTIGQWFVNNWEALFERLSNSWDRTVNDMLYNGQLLARGFRWLAGEGTALGIALGVIDHKLEENKRTVEDAEIEFTGLTKAFKDGFSVIGQFALGITGADKALAAFMSLFDEAPAKVDRTTDSVRELGDVIERAGPRWTSSLGTFAPAIRRVSDSMDEMLEKTRQIASDGLSSWTRFIEGAKQAGFDFTRFLAGEMTNALTSLAQTLGNTFAGVGNEWATGLQKALLVFADFAKNLGRMLIAIGSAMLIIPGLQGNAALYIAGGIGIVAAGTAATGLIEKSAENRRATSVNDALIRSDGSIVHLNPKDNILAMKDFASLGSGSSGSIMNVITLDGREIFRNQRRIEHNLNR